MTSNKADPAPSSGQSTSAQIHDVLMGRIQRGELVQGVRLVDTAVAAEFGVSRMPARDALMRLAHEGYLEPTTRGFVLPRLDHQEILEIFDLRRLLEPRAAALAAQAFSETELAALGETLNDARSAMAVGDAERLFRACEIFRNGWIDAVPNGSLRKALQRYMTQVQAVRLMTFADGDNHPLIVEGNARLYEAFCRRDAVAASDRILRFVFDGEAAYLAAHEAAQKDKAAAPAKAG
ncbi:GntR family transcriptional regulator [Labrenzia sp. VG12]|uniref:GntR family transcriptional regulator n=1 Tax=Labrenzia sp. VG12 TaxID=2021862 RepID=UPI000B8C5ECD|nr:GntR family transcriptional regulator [Labrenzia sp. VG12]ASP36484.1 GntR family transcriptional regulator [Labrenzia sp. VG12]